LNQSSKLLTERKIKGSKKLRRAQSSGKLFCNGVPIDLNNIN